MIRPSLEQATCCQLQGFESVQPSELGGLRLVFRSCITEVSVELD